MNKAWGYISAALGGIIVGLIAMYKIIGDTVTVTVKKVKNKKVGSSTTSIPINVETRKTRRKERRKNK
jgi:hypothetical protein